MNNNFVSNITSQRVVYFRTHLMKSQYYCLMDLVQAPIFRLNPGYDKDSLILPPSLALRSGEPSANRFETCLLFLC